MPQTVLFFGGPDTLRRNQEAMLRKVITQKGYTCQVLSRYEYVKGLDAEKEKTLKRVVRECWDFFVSSEIGLRLEEVKKAVDILLKIPENRISAIMIECSSGSKAYDVCVKESWRYLQVECPSVGVFKISGNSTPEEIHGRVAGYIIFNSRGSSANRFPYYRHD